MTIAPQVLGGLFVERVVCVWLQEEILETDHDRVEVQDGLPVLAENVQADIALEIDIWMIDLGNTLDLWGLVRIVAVNGKAKLERSAFVHALIGGNSEEEVEEIICIWPIHLHRPW